MAATSTGREQLRGSSRCWRGHTVIWIGIVKDQVCDSVEWWWWWGRLHPLDSCLDFTWRLYLYLHSRIPPLEVMVMASILAGRSYGHQHGLLTTLKKLRVAFPETWGGIWEVELPALQTANSSSAEIQDFVCWNSFSLKCLFLKFLERALKSPRTEFFVEVYVFLAWKYSTRNPRVHKQQKKRERALKKSNSWRMKPGRILGEPRSRDSQLRVSRCLHAYLSICPTMQQNQAV